MKKDMPLEGLRWSRDSGSALYDTPQNGRSRTGWGMLLFWGIILHGGICCAFLPDGRKISFIIYQRIIGSLI